MSHEDRMNKLNDLEKQVDNKLSDVNHTNINSKLDEVNKILSQSGMFNNRKPSIKGPVRK